ncbi:MAG: general secretion pathway protein GspK [Kiritimatiellia bacterium]
MSARGRKGSALILVIWTIAVLSVVVMSFAVEAKLQASVNVYVRERAQLENLIDAGKVLGEMIIANHQNATAYSEDEDLDALLEDDRWLLEKRQLKQSGATVTIGPVVVDEKMPDDFNARDEAAVADELSGRGTVTVVIESVGGGDGGGPRFNINNLQPEGDPHYAEIWENILYWVGVPEDEQEYFLNSWLDWYDKDDVKKGDYGDNARDGSESDYYEDLAEENDEEKYKPRNGPIKDLKELAWVGAFRRHPAVLTGGWYWSLDERKEEDNLWITNTLDKVLGTFGGVKINVNLAEKDVLLNIPGIRSTDDPEDLEDETMMDVVNAIIEWRNGIDMDGRAVDLDDEENGTLIKDWAKLNEICQGYIRAEAQEYLAYQGGSGDGALYRVTITASAMGMKHVVKAKMTIRNSRPVYLEWQEDP